MTQDKQLVETIRRQLTVRTATGLAVVGLVMLLVLAIPLYIQLKEANERDFSFKHAARVQLASQQLDNYKDITGQIASRTKIRDKLVEYNEGLTSKEQLVLFSRNLLGDAMKQSEDILGIVRVDKTCTPAIQIGHNAPSALMRKITALPNKTVVFDPIFTSEYTAIPVMAPIVDNQNTVIGADIVLFDAKSLEHIVRNYEGFGKSGELLVGKINKERIDSFFLSRNGKNSFSLAATASETVQITKLNTTDWAAVSHIDNDELNSILNHNISLLIGVVIAIIGIGLVGITKLISPLLLMLENNLKQLTQLHESLLEKNRMLRWQLFTDALTGLPNRNALEQEKPSFKAPALVLVNIDHFNEINDFYGSAGGDFVLKGMAQFFAQEVDTVFDTKTYRLGADDFGIIVKDYVNVSLGDFANFLLEKIEAKTFRFEHYDISVRVSIGISKESPLLEKADLALKLIKKESISKYVKFLEYHDKLGLYQNIKANFATIDRLKNALENDRIVPYFQPILNISSDRVEKYECLARLIDENGDVLPPAIFLDIAKRSKLYPQITKMMIAKSFAAFNGSDFGFSINLSNDDIENEEITDYLLTMFEKYPELTKKAQVAIEILETEGIVNYPKIYDFTHRLKELYGCKLAIDDFGAGYSNFTHMLQLKVDYLKLDSSLIKNINKSAEAQGIVRTIVAFAKELDIRTIAEFVHSQEVFDTVKELGVDYAQGYHIGKPEAHFIV